MQITDFPLVDLILLSKKQNLLFSNGKYRALNFKIGILPSRLSKQITNDSYMTSFRVWGKGVVIRIMSVLRLTRWGGQIDLKTNYVVFMDHPELNTKSTF